MTPTSGGSPTPGPVTSNPAAPDSAGLDSSASDGASSRSAIPGRVTVAERALRGVLAAVAAEQLGSRARDVNARIHDDRGRLAVAVTGPARPGTTGETLLEVGRRTRDGLASEGARLAGVQLGPIRVRISGLATGAASPTQTPVSTTRRVR